MIKFIIEETNEKLTPNAGLGMVGQLLAQTSLSARIDHSQVPGAKTTPDALNSDVAKSYIGLLCQGKSDFEMIEEFRAEPFYQYALDIGLVPSCSTLRQRLNSAANIDPDTTGPTWQSILLEESAALIQKNTHLLTPITLENKENYIPLDVDVSPFDNSNTKKEGVSWTYKKFDGYSPIFAYLGREGFGVNVELRNGKTHCQANTPEFLRQTIKHAKTITDQPLLLRLDSGNDSVDNINVCQEASTSADFIIKRNPRKETAEEWLKIAKEHSEAYEPRDGKKVYRGVLNRKPNKAKKDVFLVFEVIERTIDAGGQTLLIPDITFDTYWVSLDISADEVISLYHDHGTMEQFHSEIKTELDLERLPSGKFATNDLALHFGLFAYNLLRIIGQESLQVNDQPLRKKVQRRRIRTVIKSMITMAAKMVFHAGRWGLKMTKTNPWLPSFRRLYNKFATT